MTLEDSRYTPAASKAGLRRCPGLGCILAAAQITHAQRQIVVGEIAWRERRVIVVVTNVAQEDGFGLSFEPIHLLQRRGARWSPPGIEMRSGTAAQSRTPPAAI